MLKARVYDLPGNWTGTAAVFELRIFTAPDLCVSEWSYARTFVIPAGEAHKRARRRRPYHYFATA